MMLDVRSVDGGVGRHGADRGHVGAGETDFGILAAEGGTDGAGHGVGRVDGGGGMQ